MAAKSKKADLVCSNQATNKKAKRMKTKHRTLIGIILAAGLWGGNFVPSARAGLFQECLLGGAGCPPNGNHCGSPNMETSPPTCSGTCRTFSCVGCNSCVTALNICSPPATPVPCSVSLSIVNCGPIYWYEANIWTCDCLPPVWGPPSTSVSPC